MERPLHEPLWQKVYWFLWRTRKIKEKFEFKEIDLEDFDFIDFTYPMFDRDDMYSFWNGIAFDRILGVLINLGSNFGENDELVLHGIYDGGCKFEILAIPHTQIIVRSTLNKCSKKYKVFIDELSHLLMYSPAKEYSKQGPHRHYVWTPKHDVFSTYIPTVDYHQLYDYYYTPDMICPAEDNRISEEDFDEDEEYFAVHNFVHENFIHPEILLFDTETLKTEARVTYKSGQREYAKIKRMNSAKFVQFCLKMEHISARHVQYEHAIGYSFLANYHGTPFLLYAKCSRVFIRVQSLNTESLVEYLREMFAV